MDAINAGTQFFNNFMYSGPSECQIDDIREQTQTASRFASPIILDLDGTGINTVGLSAGVNFDHAGDGFAERTGWCRYIGSERKDKLFFNFYNLTS